MKLEQANQLIDAIEQTGVALTDWENQFLVSVSDRKYDLSDKQAACLEKIYARATGGGARQTKQRF